MSDPAPQRLCPLCGQANPADLRECGMCAEPLGDPPVAALPFGWPALLLALAWLALLIGLFAYHPGLAIAQVILTTPPVARTMILAKKRAALGKETGLARTLEMTVISFGATLLILTVGLVSAFGAFFTLCLGMVAAINAIPGLGDGLWIPGLALCGASALAAAIFAARAFRNSIVRRWYNDLNRK
jgi:hypothetical protein